MENIKVTMFSYFRSLYIIAFVVKIEGKWLHLDGLLNDLLCQISGWHPPSYDSLSYYIIYITKTY